jgi:hypothetical protein
MATSPTYFPNPIAAMPEPRFTAPQGDYSSVFQGALQSLNSVADNYRRKQQSVQSAEKMAAMLESEGLTSEANAYRQAAQAYDINFFSTPQENERFNRSLLNDSLKLLSDKQDRLLKERALNIQAEYQRASLGVQRQGIEARAEGYGNTGDYREQQQERYARQDTLNALEQDLKMNENQADDLRSKHEKLITRWRSLPPNERDALKGQFDAEEASIRQGLNTVATNFVNLQSQKSSLLGSTATIVGNAANIPGGRITALPFTGESRIYQAGEIARDKSEIPRMLPPGSVIETTLPDGTMKIEKRTSTPAPDNPTPAVKGVIDPNRPFNAGVFATPPPK